MRVTVQRRLGLPLDVACQAVEAGKRAPSGQLHDVLLATPRWLTLGQSMLQDTNSYSNV